MTEAQVRVMVVDDSAVIRGFWARLLDAQQGIRVVASAWNGRAALDVLSRKEVDVVILDIEMPEMSGIEALPHILREHPKVRVLMASSLTRKGAEVTIKALALGAADYVTKPSTTERHSLEVVGDDIVRKVRALGGLTAPRDTRAAGAPAPAHGGPAPRPAAPSGAAPRAIALTSSTGGPNALSSMLGALPADYPLPILVVQHMPAIFTTMLADRIARATGRPCIEATDGLEVTAGHTYVAPGDFHMTVREDRGRVIIALDQNAQENFCRPSADPLFRSMARVYGSALLGVVLTGMGHDGLEGARALVGVGARVVVQDQATSVVWGMPGAVANAGLAHEILPLERIAPFLDEQARVAR